MHKPPLLATVFTDYICPFCFIGHLRLLKLNQDYDLRVNWCFVEIHPSTPPEGLPVAELGHSPQQLKSMMDELNKMALEEGVNITPDRFTTNSNKALLLAEAAKEEGKIKFYHLQHQLFLQFFTEGKNIGDPSVLKQIAHEVGISDQTIEKAWTEARFADRLKQNLLAAAELGITGVPCFVIGEKKLVGAVTLDALQEAARDATAANHSGLDSS